MPWKWHRKLLINYSLRVFNGVLQQDFLRQVNDPGKHFTCHWIEYLTGLLITCNEGKVALRNPFSLSSEFWPVFECLFWYVYLVHSTLSFISCDIIKLPEFESGRQHLAETTLFCAFETFQLFSSSLYFNMNDRTPYIVTGKVHKN